MKTSNVDGHAFWEGLGPKTSILILTGQMQEMIRSLSSQVERPPRLSLLTLLMSFLSTFPQRRSKTPFQEFRSSSSAQDQETLSSYLSKEQELTPSRPPTSMCSLHQVLESVQVLKKCLLWTRTDTPLLKTVASQTRLFGKPAVPLILRLLRARLCTQRCLRPFLESLALIPLRSRLRTKAIILFSAHRFRSSFLPLTSIYEKWLKTLQD